MLTRVAATMLCFQWQGVRLETDFGVKMGMSFDQIRKALTEGCSEEDFLQIRCPKCGSEVLFVVHPNGKTFFVRCMADNAHLSMHDQNPTPPQWWNRFMQKAGWM
jgi:hypothetical protein